MDITPSQVSELIRKRRSIFPKSYNGKPISREIVQEVLENANWAPTHKMTEPWRFKVMAGGGLERLSQFLSAYYKEHTPADKFSEVKFKKLKNNPLKASCIIAICMKRDGCPTTGSPGRCGASTGRMVTSTRSRNGWRLSAHGPMWRSGTGGSRTKPIGGQRRAM